MNNLAAPAGLKDSLWIDGKRVAPNVAAGVTDESCHGDAYTQLPSLARRSMRRARQNALPGCATRPAPLGVMQKFLDLMRKLSNRLDTVTEDTEDDCRRSWFCSAWVEVAEFACGIPQLAEGEYSENVDPRWMSFHPPPVGGWRGITP